MPRKAFVADLQEAIASFKRINVSGLKAGEEDGMITFEYQHDGSVTEITALVPDLGDYPDAHMYLFYTKSEQVDPLINKVVDDMSDCTSIKVADMLMKLTRSLDRATAGSKLNPVDIEDGDPMNIDSDSGLQEEDLDELEEEYDSDDNAWSQNPSKPHWNSSTNARANNSATTKILNSRIRSDLGLVKQAGFRVGHLGSLLDGGQDSFVTISIRVAKLGISEEALDAWHLDRSQYFVLLIRYTSGYQTIESLMGSIISNTVQFRVGVSSEYKIAIDEAIAAFTKLEDKSKTRKLVTEGVTSKSGLGRLFIGRPLDELLNDRLIPLLRYRMAMGFPWRGAEEFLNDHQGRNLDSNAADPKYWAEEEATSGLGNDDHLISNTKEKSFPLLAMQFSLRHLVRCTEFCLVCHCKIEVDFEALKPYVCDKPLCLYQYMSLGFGPSIEHEIITQPHVVDLLISFCYTSASHRRLRYLPTGMALMVPTPDSTNNPNCETGYPRSHYGPSYDQDPTTKALKQPKVKQGSKTYKARLNRQRMELLFDSKGDKPPLQAGSWIMLTGAGVIDERWHCRVNQALYPTFRLGQPIVRQPRNTASQTSNRNVNATNQMNVPPAPTPAATPPPIFTSDASSQHQNVDFVIYDLNFDDLERNEKQISICMLLDTMPSVKDMKDFLLSKGGQEASLRAWTDHCSPAALGILRWIIASNRSCIVQVDSIDGGLKKSEERVSGMPNWMQFRFAQGAPDKEQRFMTSIRNTTSNARYPTMFAWHGSPLHNWHGIVREGLHFENADHGRAFGNGVYHALNVSTSMSYSNSNFSFGGRYGNEDSQTVSNPGEWPQSHLRISQALALNEIVNAPAQFVSKSPHLVVAQLDWIQSRYLFVRCNIHGYQIPETYPTQVYAQDPSYQAVGSSQTPLVLPLNAVSKSRRPVRSTSSASVENVNKKAKVEVTPMTNVEDSVLLSDDTDVEDLAIFFSDPEDEPQTELQATSGASQEKASGKFQAKSNKSHTDFEPGRLEASSLQLLEPPSYATQMATRALQRELTGTLKVQDSHPAHELGWYINPELISNVYQWIVELHSFETHLPLAKDMKSNGLKSVVLEIRFGKDYPMSPPFVRVLRPRFLSFMQGGGGHVTAGGALCMELLTNSGWSAVSNIESVLLQVRLAMSSTDPKPARLEPGPVRGYQVGEAVDAYIRACHAHGWEVPRDFRSNYGGSSTGFLG